MRNLKIILPFITLTLLLAACSNNKIAKSQQEVRQEKVDQAKKKITSTLKKNRADSSKVESKKEDPQVENDRSVATTEANSGLNAYDESDRGTDQTGYASLIENGAWLNEEQISDVAKKHIDQRHKLSVILSVHGRTTSIICTTCDELLDEWQNPVDNYDTQDVQQGKLVDQGAEIKLPAVQIPHSIQRCLEKGHTIYTTVDTIHNNRHFECSDCEIVADCPVSDIGK